MTIALDQGLCGFLRTACARAEAGLPEDDVRRRAIAAVRERLSDDVLRIAVAGRLNAGKSTLVNALIGRRLAPTYTTECTTIATWFRYGDAESVTLRFADGSEINRRSDNVAKVLAAEKLPAGKLAEVTEIEVRSRISILKKYAIVDTPGLDTTSDFDDVALAALRKADVLIFVTRHPGAADRNAFARLRDEAAGLPAVAVLSRIDEIDNGRKDPWPIARRTADHGQRELGADVSMVLPVIGLLAETALSDQFGEEDVRPLRRLYEFAQAEADAVARYTASDYKEGHAKPLSAEDGGRLVTQLGSYGIREALERFRTEAGVRGASDLLGTLRANSGIGELLDQMQLQFLSVADPLRAQAAMRVLDTIAWPTTSSPDSAALARLRGDLAWAAADPELLLIDIVGNLTAWWTGRWTAPEMADPTIELSALVTGTTVRGKLGLPAGALDEQVQDMLMARVGAWRVIEGSGSLDTTRRARSVREYLEALHGAVRRRS